MGHRSYDVTPRNRVVRVPKRARYDEATVHAVLDEAQVCHVGIDAGGQPIVIPMFFARLGDEILLHSARKGRLASHIEAGSSVCITVTVLDGLVLARSAFHHSMNYRSAVVFGTGRRVESDEIDSAVRAITEKVMPGRADDCRAPNATELKATTILAVRIESASAKVRTGGPVDDEEDMDLPHWAGVVPLRQISLEPEPDAARTQETPLPGYVTEFVREHGLHPPKG